MCTHLASLGRENAVRYISFPPSPFLSLSLSLNSSSKTKNKKKKEKVVLHIYLRTHARTLMNSALIDMAEESYESSRKRSAAGAAGTAGPDYPCAAKGKAAGKREEEEELDEEMDKFYALLGNFRALKDHFRRQHGDAGGSTSSKRLRTEEEAPPPPPPPPRLPTWKPTFQLEDFKHPSGNEKEEGNLRKDEENHMEQRLEDGASLDLSLAL